MLTQEESQPLLRRLFRKSPAVQLAALYKALETRSRMSVFRRLRPLGYLSSYTHTGRYYTLLECAQFDPFGLWRWRDVGFSRARTVKATITKLVDASPSGYTPRELQERLHTRVHNAITFLAHRGKIQRQPLPAGGSIYVSADSATGARQFSRRLAAAPGSAPPTSTAVIEVLLHLVQAAHLEATPEAVAEHLAARGSPVTVQQVRAVFARYKLGGKKGARSPLSRR